MSATSKDDRVVFPGIYGGHAEWYYEPGFEPTTSVDGKVCLWGFFHRCKSPAANVGVLTRKRIPLVDKTIYMCDRCEAEPPKQVRAMAMLKVIGEKR